MKSFRVLVLTVIGYLVFSSYAYAINDPNAAVVKLRDPNNGGCVEAGVMLNNCVADSSVNFDGLSNASSFIVEVGPGTFGQMFCGGNGSVSSGKKISIRGAGVDKTTLASLTLFKDCSNTSFADMTLGGTGISYAVVVINPGTTTTWTNVKLVGPWQEYCVGASTTGGKHYWFGSQILTASGGGGGHYQVKCDQSWFFGSEITAKGLLTSGEVIPFKVSGSELHVYGSVIRALGMGTGAPSDLHALTAVSASGGQVHIHGTGIDVIAMNGAPVAAIALSASNGAMIHANASSYNLRTGAGGTVTRIIKDQLPNTHVHAPYIWEHIPEAPLVSVTGADMTTVTTGTSDGQPHLVIYSTNCTSKWYDTVDKMCRP